MRNFAFLLCITVGLFSPAHGSAQDSQKGHRIGFLWPGNEARSAVVLEALRTGLRDLGYDGKNTIDIEREYAAGAMDRIPALTSVLPASKAEIIVTASIPAALAATKAAPGTPIVVGAAGDFVGNRLAVSMEKPGGNITGVDEVAPGLSAKRLQLLHEATPSIKSIAIFSSATGPTFARQMEESEQAAQPLGLTLKTYKLTSPADIEPTFSAISSDHMSGLLVFSGSLTAINSKSIVDLAARNRLPAMYWTTQFTTDGGLMYYGPKLTAMFRQSAMLVHRILKGEKAGEIPIEYPKDFELLINLKAAGQQGITLSDAILRKADQVIQ